ncbi:MAG TPA: energy-dependent translational throttle protein EttA [Myxococcales bacterium LLY-WYZ-16_1]|nr:energy-dependent translational throttle protein EttA [Myxococcales bacterium LLY-WYZ-16_1]
MAEFVYTMQNVRKAHPGKEVIRDLTLAFLPGAKIGILGANGAGKSTLLKIMAGWDTEYTGEAKPGKGVSVGFLPQEPQLDPDKTVRENVEEGVAPIRRLLEKFEEVSARFAEPLDDDAMQKLLDEQARLQDQVEAVDGWEIDNTLERAMDALRCPPQDQPVAHLSGGEKRRVALCRILLERPDMLLLDEPTNHLDADSVAWLERHLAEYSGTVVAVTHDRYFLDNVAGWILELDRGHGIPWKGNYSSWLEQKAKRLADEEKQASARRRTLERELDWVRQSPRGRQAKSKARLNKYNELLEQEQKDKLQEIEIPIPPGPRLGDLVVEADGLKKGFKDKLLFEDLSFKLPPGGIVGIIGGNGAGKTTLFRMLVGQESPDAGELKVGETVKFAYVDQNRDTLEPDAKVWEEIADGADTIEVGKRSIPARSYAAAFGFTGSDQQKLVGSLSGGERNRVQLAKLLKSGGNVLLLDEPTNDLDVDTLRALEDAILEFAGCVLVISHDRWFLDRIATHILAFEGDSKVVFFPGNFQEYEADRKKRLGQDADTPHRIKYRRLTAQS